VNSEIKDLHLVINDAGGVGYGADELLKARKVKKITGSYIGHS